MSGHRANKAGGSQRGFSLLELVLVVAIFAILAAIAAPRYGRAAARYRAEVAARRIAADVALARKSARSAGAERTVTFSVDCDEYSIAGLAGLRDSSTDYRVDLTAGPYEARILVADFGGDAKLVFDGYGTPDSGGHVRVQVGEAVRTVVFDANSCEATIQ
jgi:prepilin-type N-terminal cleavage/methylation domain-containing protein